MKPVRGERILSFLLCSILIQASLLSGLFCSPLPASSTSTTLSPSNQSPIHFESEALEYQEAEQVIIASGNVKVQQSSYTFYSDHAIFNVPEKNLEAWGLVRFSTLGGDEIRARLLNYSIDNGSAQLLDTEGYFGPWIFAAKKVTRDENGNFVLERAKLSTCETNLSKYHLYGHKIKLLPNKRLTVYHALFRVGPVPVLYLPYYYYSLGEKHLAFQVFPGQNQSEGAFVRTVWGYPPTDQTYVRAYLDYLSNRGIGTGGEFNYYFDEKAKGSVYGFRIFDKISREERWNARLFHWQTLTPAWTLQLNANRLSDDSFPNDFFREDFNRVVRDPKSSLAFTHQGKNKIFRIYGERSELFDTGNRKFFPGEILSPRIEFNSLQSALGVWGLEKSYALSFTNKFAGTGNTGELLPRFHRRESGAHFSILRRMRLSRQTSFVPKVTLRNQWADRPQGSEPNEPLVQKAETEATLRQSFGNNFDLDLTYLIAQRLQGNSGEDQGRENHSLSYFSLYQTQGWISFRSEITHNLPRFKGEPLSFLERKNYRPLQAELTLSPNEKLEIFLREQYTFFDPVTGSMHPLSTQSEFTWGRRNRGENYFSVGTSYFSSQPDAFVMRKSARISSLKKWKIEGTLRSLFSYRNSNFFNLKKIDLVEKELLVRKEWRCWELSFTFRERSGVVEFLFNFELKLGRIEREETPSLSQGSEWYPWRDWQ